MNKLEICVGGIEDCLQAQKVGANRIELNSALYLGGLTPSVGVLKQAIERKVTIPIICMVRPRGGGFCYSAVEKDVMFEDARYLLEQGADGIAFGFLTEKCEIDWQATEKMIQLCQHYHADSVMHRAFDCAKHPEENLQRLIQLGCTRVLTSGQGKTVMDGLENLTVWQKQYGKQIEILAGCGVTIENIPLLLEAGIQQVHGSFKEWKIDPTTTTQNITYAYTDAGDYEMCHPEKMRRAVQEIYKGETE